MIFVSLFLRGMGDRKTVKIAKDRGTYKKNQVEKVKVNEIKYQVLQIC